MFLNDSFRTTISWVNWFGSPATCPSGLGLIWLPQNEMMTLNHGLLVLCFFESRPPFGRWKGETHFFQCWLGSLHPDFDTLTGDRTRHGLPPGLRFEETRPYIADRRGPLPWVRDYVIMYWWGLMDACQQRPAIAIHTIYNQLQLTFWLMTMLLSYLIPFVRVPEADVMLLVLQHEHLIFHWCNFQWCWSLLPVYVPPWCTARF